MNARLDTRWQYNGLTAVVMENQDLQMVIFPQTGARIYTLLHKPTDSHLLWHHPRIVPGRTPYGASFNDVFPGGWDEMLPGADGCVFRGETYPDHGELWSLDWDYYPVETGDGSACLYTGVATPILPLRFERWLRLSADQPIVHIDYRLTNLGTTPLPLIWGIHPLFTISPDHRLDLPAGQMLVDHASDEAMGKPGQAYRWPMLPSKGGSRDMRLIPPAESGLYGGHYAVGPEAGWFALTDTRRRVGVAMHYPEDVFRALWLWQSYGGWRGLYHLAVEPWVGYPVRLDQAVEAGREHVIGVGESVQYRVSLIVYTGLEHVVDVSPHVTSGLSVKGG